MKKIERTENIENIKKIEEEKNIEKSKNDGNKENRENKKTKKESNLQKIIAYAQEMGYLDNNAVESNEEWLSRPFKIIDKRKTIERGREICDDFSFYVENQLKLVEAKNEGFPSYSSIIKAPESEGFIGTSKTVEKLSKIENSPCNEFIRLIILLKKLDPDTGKYLELRYVEQLRPRELPNVWKEYNYKRIEKIGSRAHFNVACLTNNVILKNCQ